MKSRIIISVRRGIVSIIQNPDNVPIELYDYDINEIEENNPDRHFSKDTRGDYEIIGLW